MDARAVYFDEAAVPVRPIDHASANHAGAGGGAPAKAARAASPIPGSRPACGVIIHGKPSHGRRLKIMCQSGTTARQHADFRGSHLYRLLIIRMRLQFLYQDNSVPHEDIS
jgi:hypothetical protein